MATNEELETRIAELEGMVVSSYDPPSGPEYSFPQPGQPIDQDQFQLLSLPSGNGVIDRGEGSYWLMGWGSSSETNQKNSMRLTVGRVTKKAEAIVAGYYHVMTEEKEIQFPAVTKNTLYKVCLTFDPRYIDETGEESNQSVSVQVYDGEPPTTFGRVHLLLWSLERKPNQLLSDANYYRSRPRISPVVYVANEEQKPDIGSVLWGSICIVGGTANMWRALPRDESDPNTQGDGDWYSLTSPTFSNPGDTATYEWAGHGYRRGYRRVGDVLEFRGRLKKTDGGKFVVGGGGNALGYQFYNMFNEDDWPDQEQRFITASSYTEFQKLCVITVTTDGMVYGMPILGDTDWISLDGVRVVIRE